MQVTGEDLSIEQVVAVARAGDQIEPLNEAVASRMQAGHDGLVAALERNRETIYGVNTGFGPLAQVRLESAQAEQLSRNLVLSAMSGVGPSLAGQVVRAMMLIRINSLANGLSAVRPRVVETLRQMLNSGVTPEVPSKGSLGASGDLAPQAHIAAVLSAGSDDFSGQAWYEGQLLTGAEAMQRAGIDRVELAAKEGLGLTNGTDFMLAGAALGAYDAENLVRHAVVAAALSYEALLGLRAALDARIHAASGQTGQQRIARNLRVLLRGSALVDSNAERVQDPYSLRCTPQLVGPISDLLAFLRERVTTALNAVTDNPLFFLEGEKMEAISGGNFHGQGPSLWLDVLGIAAAQLGTISERRIFRMTTPELSEGLPSMLVRTPGLDSGLMMPQYTAAALVSDNKTLAHPDSVDSIPSSANQEDHVSMGANAARHTLEILENVRNILAAELLTAAQAIDLRKNGSQNLGEGTAPAHQEIRKHIPFLEHDRPLSSDLETLADLISSSDLVAGVEAAVDTSL